MTQADIQTVIDHAFRPRWRNPEACAFERSDGTDCTEGMGAHRFAHQPQIEIEVWKPNPKALEPGFEHFRGTVVIDYRRTIQDVLDELNAKLPLEGVAFDESAFSNMTKYEDPAYMEEGPRKYSRYSLPWPEYRRIAVFPVTGGSEGHYVHIGVIHMDGTFTCLGLCKTFRGWDHACRIAAAVGRLLQA